jgi:uncharacterized protein YecE (DUF72 family)
VAKRYRPSVRENSARGVAVSPIAGMSRLTRRLNNASRDHLRYIRDQWPDLTIVTEFRHREWVEDEATFELLEDEEMSFVCVDEPSFKGLVPPSVRATSTTGYVRFHGRNYQKWWHHDKPEERYDYLYSEDELEEWIPRLLRLESRTEKTYVSMNNHRRGQATVNGRMLPELLSIIKPEYGKEHIPAVEPRESK